MQYRYTSIEGKEANNPENVEKHMNECADAGWILLNATTAFSPGTYRFRISFFWTSD